MFGWDKMFRVTVSPRLHNLLGALGVPRHIAAAPEELTNPSQHFWLHRWQPTTLPGIRAPSGSLNLIATEHIQLLEDVFNQFSNAYGADDAQSLYVWGQNHYVIPLRSGRIIRWSHLLWSAHFRGAVRQTPRLPQRVVDAYNLIVANYRRTIRKNYDSVEHALTEPPTPFELQYVLVPDRPPGAPLHKVDVELRNAFQAHAVLEAWRELDIRLTAPERARLLELATEYQSQQLPGSSVDTDPPEFA